MDTFKHLLINTICGHAFRDCCCRELKQQYLQSLQTR